MADVTLQQFEAEAHEFLSSNAKPRVEATQRWGEGSDKVGLFRELTPEEEAAEVARAKEWRGKVYDAGFGWITGPPAFGGRGLSREHERVWHAAEARYDTPTGAPFGIGLGMVAPTILAHGQEHIRERYLPALYRGDMIACQLFSEPVAGSDLAGIQTRATQDGDEWVISGQKVWTSGAQYSDIGEIITRTSTDPDSRHAGLSMFVVDMHAPGVEVRPLRQMTGGASFNEVFFDDVRIPADHLLGDVGHGWTVALTTLMNERFAIGGGGSMDIGRGFSARLRDLAHHLDAGNNPLARQQIADIYIRAQVSRFTTLRASAKMRAGQLPGAEMSTLKLALTQNLQKVSQAVTTLLGPRLIADTGEWGTYAWADLILGVPGLRVAGGTDEVMRNIVGERVLGLPKEPRGA